MTRADEERDRLWTTWLTADPVALIGNVFGGGDRQRAELTIDNLELTAARLETDAATLESRQAEMMDTIEREIAATLAERDELSRRIATDEQRLKIYELSFIDGEGSIDSYLSRRQRLDDMHVNLQTIDDELRQICTGRDIGDRTLGDIQSTENTNDTTNDTTGRNDTTTH